MSDTLTDSAARELGVLADLRTALGDPLGRLMQDELVQHAAGIVAERDKLRGEVEALRRQLNAKVSGGGAFPPSA